MTIEILPVKVPGLWPITAEVGSIKVAGTTIAERIRSRFPESDRDIQIKVRGDFLPSPEFAGVLANSTGNCVVRDPAVHLEVLEHFLEHAKRHLGAALRHRVDADPPSVGSARAQ